MFVLASTFFVPHTAFAAATLTQRAYMFFDDAGTTVASTTPYSGAATNTTLTSVIQGVRFVARLQIDNTG